MAFGECCSIYCTILSGFGAIFLTFIGILISIETPFINIDFTSEERKNTEISIYVTAGLYLIFAGLSLFGYLRIKKKQAQQKQEQMLGGHGEFQPLY